MEWAAGAGPTPRGYPEAVQHGRTSSRGTAVEHGVEVICTRIQIRFALISWSSTRKVSSEVDTPSRYVLGSRKCIQRLQGLSLSLVDSTKSIMKIRNRIPTIAHYTVHVGLRVQGSARCTSASGGFGRQIRRKA